MILQLLFDDKFADYAIRQFQPFGHIVRTALVKRTADTEIEYSQHSDEIEVLSLDSSGYEDMKASLADYSAVIMHGLFAEWQYDIVRRLPVHVKLAWVLWGAEVYDRPKVYMSHLTLISRLLVRARNIKLFFSGKKDKKNVVPMDVLRRVDYCMNSSAEVFEEVKKTVGNPALQHLPYSYFTLEDLIGRELYSRQPSGHNILLGNSATILNNHIDIIRRLERLGLSDGTKVITPLSYGSPWVRNIIQKYGRHHLGINFMPLTDFMPRSEYNSLVMSCSSFITNHHRPNAFGNVLTCLWAGVRVWSSKWNAQTLYLKRLGFSINIIEEDLKNHPELLISGMTDSEINSNRCILRREFGGDAMALKISNIIDVLG